MICDRYDVVRVPFPFTDKAATKRRPALVLSRADDFNRVSHHAVMAMVTSANSIAWPHDCVIKDLRCAGLPAPSKVRMKLFTLDLRLVLGILGRLSEPDVKAVERALRTVLGTIDTATG